MNSLELDWWALPLALEDMCYINGIDLNKKG